MYKMSDQFVQSFHLSYNLHCDTCYDIIQFSTNLLYCIVDFLKIYSENLVKIFFCYLRISVYCKSMITVQWESLAGRKFGGSSAVCQTKTIHSCSRN